MYAFHPDRLVALLESRKVDDATVAEKIGISRQMIFRWRTGQSIPQIGAVLKMCDYFDVEIGYFFLRPPKEETRPKT